MAEARFAASEIAAFGSYLESRAGRVFAMLADTVDESFELEHIPHVRGRGGRALIARKRERHCHGSPLCIGLPQGRQPDGRRDDRVLFAALTRPQALEPWLQRLEQAQALLCGVYSMSQVVAELAPEDCALLVTFGHGGMRQTFIAGRQLRFSRLTPAAQDGEQAARACAAEAMNVRRYLCGQRMIDADAPLSLCALVHPARLDAFRRHCRDTDGLRFRTVDAAGEARRRRFRGALSDSGTDALFVHMLATKLPHHQFAPGSMLQRWRTRKARLAIDVFGGIAFAASLLFAAAQLPGVLATRDAAAELQARNDGDERVRRGARVERPDLPLPASELRDLAAAMAQLTSTLSGPRPLLAHLGRAMDEVAAIRLDSLEWRLADEVAPARGPSAVLEVRGFSSDTDARQQELGVAQLVGQLRRGEAIDVVIVKQPGAPDPDQALTNGDAAKADGAFALRLVQKL